MPQQFVALEALQPALRHTWAQLFQPFRLGLWARLALVGILTGEFPGCGAGGGGGGARSSAGQGDQFGALPTDTISLLLLIFLGALLVMVLILAMLYLSAVFRFVLFDIILTDRHQLLESYRRWRQRGLSFFLWQLALTATMIVTLALMVGVPALAAAAAGAFAGPLPGLAVMMALGLWLVLNLIGIVIVTVFVWVLARDFVVPIMALEEVGVVEGWRRFLPLLLAQKLEYLIYFIVRTVAAVVSAVCFGILALLMVVAVVLVGGGMGLTLILAGWWAAWTWNLYTIVLGAVVGGAALLAMMYVIAFMYSPAVAFFPTYAAHFLGLSYPRLAEALSRHPVTRTGAGGPAQVTGPPDPEPF